MVLGVSDAWMQSKGLREWDGVLYFEKWLTGWHLEKFSRLQKTLFLERIPSHLRLKVKKRANLNRPDGSWMEKKRIVNLHNCYHVLFPIFCENFLVSEVIHPTSGYFYRNNFSRSFLRVPFFSAALQNLILPYVGTVGNCWNCFTFSFGAFIPFQAFHPSKPSVRKLFICAFSAASNPRRNESS